MPVTFCLFMANLIVFAVYVWQSSWAGLFVYSPVVLHKMGAIESGSILYYHQYWRLITGLFLHANVPHIFCNMVSLVLFGRMLERMIGSLRFFVLYIFSGLFGALLSVGLHPYGECVGASGAILGLVGFYITLQLQKDKKDHPAISYRLRQLLGLGLALYALSLTPGVDNAGHFGGLIAGIVCGGMFQALSNFKLFWGKRDFIVLFTMTGLFAAALAAEDHFLGRSPMLLEAMVTGQAQSFLHERKYKEAIASVDEGLKKLPNDENLLLLRASVLTDQHIFPLALQDVELVLARQPKNVRALFLRGAIYYSLGQYENALQDSDASAAVEKSALAYNLSANALLALGRYEEALQRAREALEINRDMTEAIDTEAMALAYQNKSAAALPLLSRAIDLDGSEHGIYYYHRALVYSASGDIGHAGSDMKEAEKLTYVLDKWEVDRPLPRVQ